MPNPFEDLHVFRCQQKFAANFPGKKKMDLARFYLSRLF